MNVEYLQKSGIANQNCKQFGIKIKTALKPKSASVFFPFRNLFTFSINVKNLSPECELKRKHVIMTKFRCSK